MKFKFIDTKIHYDGTQLKSLYSYLNHGILGDSIIAFEGTCDVNFDNMVDGEDFLARSEIRGGHMLHFLIEEFGMGMELAVTRQRLFTALSLEEINKMIGLSPKNLILTRDGDDLYLGDGKLSISIATVSPVSALIHFAMNVTNENTPIKTSSLSDLNITPKTLAEKLAGRYVREIETIKEACCKVHWVK